MNLKQVRKKIKSVKNVKKITRAMQLVSSVKMKKAQEKALSGRPYREHLEEMIRRVSHTQEMRDSQYFLQPGGSATKDLVIFVTANKGLCGSFLTQLDRYVLKHVPYEKTDFITIGKKGAQFLGITKGTIIADFTSNHPELEIGAIFSFVLEQFGTGQYRSVSIVYNRFINTLRFETVQERIMPLSYTEVTDAGTQLTSTDSEDDTPHGLAQKPYTIEPLSTEIIDALLQSYMEEKIRSALLNSEAAEHSARMIAMKGATENANNVIYNLTLEGNKIRQEAITNELLDMVSAKESVEGSA